MTIVKPSPADEEVTGNLLLDRMLGVEIVEAGGRESEAVLDETLARLRAEGRTPYASTREPFSRLAGTVAYTEASIELRDQLRRPASRTDSGCTCSWWGAPPPPAWPWGASCSDSPGGCTP